MFQEIYTKKQLNQISKKTISHYDDNASGYFSGTKDHDVSQNIDSLLSSIKSKPPFKILDFGCGPGRDLKTFKQMGHQAIGLDGSIKFVEMAKKFSQCEVWHQDFLNLKLPKKKFDGIFANASIFHIPSQCLNDVLSHIYNSLKYEGVFFCSNPKGLNYEGWSSNRYGSYYNLDLWLKIMQKKGFKKINHFFRPKNLPKDEQKWIASTWKKIN